MKNDLLKKLRSQTGASITYALLLFLVCAVLCSVIITAATASSGRMSKMAETDQRYYAVTSAAELLKEMFQEHPTISIVKVEEKEETTTYTSGSAGTPVAGETTTKVYIVPDRKASEIRESDYKYSDGTDKDEFLLEKDSEATLTFQNDTLQKDAAKNVYNNALLTNRSLLLSSDYVSGLAYDTLSVDVLENIDADGNLTFTLYNEYKANGSASDAGSRYTLVLSFAADRSVSTDKKTKNVSTTSLDDTSYKVKTKTTKTTTTTLTWNLQGIRTVS